MKHDHNKTKKLKVSLFAMIMFLPFIAIGITSATHIFNKEVSEETETAEITYKYELPTEISNNVENYYNKLIRISTYPVNDESIQVKYITDGTNIFESTQPKYIDLQGDNVILEIDNEEYINFDANNLYVVPTYLYSGYYQNITIPINNDYNVIQSVNITTNPTDQTTNIFYDSCDQVKQSFILSWCGQQNPLRTTIQNFTNAVALPNDHIVNDLLTYWLSITLIYVVIDIIIELFIYITHFFNKEV